MLIGRPSVLSRTASRRIGRPRSNVAMFAVLMVGWAARELAGVVWSYVGVKKPGLFFKSSKNTIQDQLDGLR